MKRIIIMTFVLTHLLFADKFIGKLYSPVGSVKVMHNEALYRAKDNFRLYRGDVVKLFDANASCEVVLYPNGSMLYTLEGNTIFVIDEYLLENKALKKESKEYKEPSIEENPQLFNTIKEEVEARGVEEVNIPILSDPKKEYRKGIFIESNSVNSINQVGRQKNIGIQSQGNVNVEVRR